MGKTLRRFALIFLLCSTTALLYASVHSGAVLDDVALFGVLAIVAFIIFLGFLSLLKLHEGIG